MRQRDRDGPAQTTATCRYEGDLASEREVGKLGHVWSSLWGTGAAHRLWSGRRGVRSYAPRMANHTVVGRVVSLFRYPVKSMAAQVLDEVDVSWAGLAGDRRWAFIQAGHECSGFPWLTVRELPLMWKYRPSFVDPLRPDKSPTMVRTPAGSEFDVVDPELAAELGPGVRVIKQERGVFDAFPLSLISTRTVADLGETVGDDLDPMRFRPN